MGGWVSWIVQVAFVCGIGTAFLSYFLPDAPWWHWVGLAALAGFFIRASMHIGFGGDD